MKSRIAGATAIACLAVAAPAVASTARPESIRAESPEGWAEQPGLANNVATALGQSSPFGELPAAAGGQAYVDPGDGAFYLSWLVAERAGGAGAIRSALDRVRESRVLASPEASATEELDYAETVRDNVAEARLSWRHPSNETETSLRTLAWIDLQGRPRLVKAECVLGTTAGKTAPDARALCDKALSALAVVPPAGDVGSLTSLPAAAPISAASGLTAEGHGEATDAPATVGLPPAGAGGKVLYSGQGPAKKDSHGRWLMIAGLVVLALGITLFLRSRGRSRSQSSEPASAERESEPPEEEDS